MSIANTQTEDAIADLNRRIAEAEMRSTAAADRLAALTRSEADTIEAQQQLWEEMDALLTLRHQLWGLRSSDGA
jgi:predicted  nucleic acid-binding Zn-ribbon protein